MTKEDLLEKIISRCFEDPSHWQYARTSSIKNIVHSFQHDEVALLLLKENADWFITQFQNLAVSILKEQAENDRTYFDVASRCSIFSKHEPKKSSSKILISENFRKAKGVDNFWNISRFYRIPHTEEQLNTYGGWMSLKNKAVRMNIPNKSSRLFYVPHYNKNVLLHHIDRALAAEKIRDNIRKDFDRMESVRTNEISCRIMFAELYKYLKEDTFPLFYPLLEKTKSGSDLHEDIISPLDRLTPFFTPTTAKIFCEMSDSERRKWAGLGAYRSSNPELQKILRRRVSLCLRKGISFEDTCKKLESITDNFILQQYKLSHEQAEYIATHYLPILRRYNKRITISQFLNIFGKNGTKKILKGPPCIFTPTQYRLPSMEKATLASLVADRLGHQQDEQNLKARKRLYARLSRLAPVEELLNGNFSEELVPAIKKELNLSPNKELNYAKKFVAKIEKKASPEFLIAGDASVCCMSIGTEKATTYALEKGFGVFNVYFDGRIIANSVLWVNNEDTLVIDNIEVHPNYQKHTEYIREMYHQMMKDMGKTYPNIVQGHTYNDLELYSYDNPFGTLKNWNPTAINTPRFYSDARSGCFLIKGDKEIFKSKNNLKNESQEQDEAATPFMFW